jgi:hypothetical protein
MRIVDTLSVQCTVQYYEILMYVLTTVELSWTSDGLQEIRYSSLRTLFQAPSLAYFCNPVVPVSY